MTEPKKRSDPMIYGISPVKHCLLAGKRQCERLLVKDGEPSPQTKEIVSLAHERRVPVTPASVQTLAITAKNRHHQGAVLLCGELPTLSLKEYLRDQGMARSCLVALDQIQDPQNLGAIIRTAAFLGATGLITLRHSSAPLSAVVSKASAGALEFFPIIQETNLADVLARCRDAGYTIAGTALTEDSVDFRRVSPADQMVLVLGNEGSGLRPLTLKRCDAVVRIPGTPGVESLNVNAAAAILLQHFASPGPAALRDAPANP